MAVGVVCVLAVQGLIQYDHGLSSADRTGPGFRLGVVSSFAAGFLVVRDDGIQGSGATSVGENAEVSDAVEPCGQAMQQEASDEGLGGQADASIARRITCFRHRLAVAEGDGIAVEGEDPGIGDGDAVGIA